MRSIAATRFIIAAIFAAILLPIFLFGADAIGATREVLPFP